MIQDNRITPSEATTSKDLVVITNNRAVTTSIKVAEVFGKRHDNVLKNIKALDCSEEFLLLNFQESNYLNKQGKTQPMMEMTRDGFTFLAMGFNGAKATKFKEDYIAAFNKMEEMLKAAAAAPDLVSIHTVRFLLAEYDKKDAEVKQLTTENRELKPKGEYYDAFAELGHSTTLSRLAKHIGCKPVKFTAQLRKDKILFHQGGIDMPYQPYVDKGYFEIAMRIDGYGNYCEQTRVTAKGVLFLTSRYGKATQKLEARQRLKQLENLERAKGQPGLRLITSAATVKKAAEKSAQPAASAEKSA
jgi:Rha family phage regulatory protein